MRSILFVIDELGSGGSQRQMAELADQFQRKGINVSVLAYVPANFYEDIFDKADVKITIIPEKSYFKRAVKIRRFIRRGNFDSVYSTLPGPNMAAILAGPIIRKWKLIVSEGSANPAILKFDRSRIYRWCYLFADEILANSQANIDLILKAVPFLAKKKLSVIYNFVNFDKFHPAKDFTFRKDGKLTLVIAARHNALKNLNGLIEAVNLLPQELRSDLSIEWYGVNNSDDSLEKGQEKINKYGLNSNFNFHDATTSIEVPLSKADAVGLFSFYEGVPNAICEGMAMGKPVIASAVSDVPLLIGEKKLLCDPKDPGSIAAALTYLLSLSHEELRRVGDDNYKKALELFDKERILQEYTTVLGI